MYTGIQAGYKKRLKLLEDRRTACTKAYLIIQVPLTLYFTSLEKSKASVQHIQSLYPMFHWLNVFFVHSVISYCIYCQCQRGVKGSRFKAKVTDLQYSTGPLMSSDVSAESSKSCLTWKCLRDPTREQELPVFERFLTHLDILQTVCAPFKKHFIKSFQNIFLTSFLQ